MNVFGHIIEGSLEVKFPTIWRDEKQIEQGRGREKKKDADI